MYQDRAGKIRILALGDSYTIGEKVDPDASWIIQLSERLKQKGWDIEDPFVMAKTGWTTDELMRGIKDTDISVCFDIVTLLVGVNNQYRGRDTAKYRDQFGELLDSAIMYAGQDTSRVIVISIPDWGVTPFANGRDVSRISREIDLFNLINHEAAENKGVTYINITDISRDARFDLSLLAEDGLHPSRLMYSKWIDRILPVVELILGETE